MGRLGQKPGAGFYTYSADRTPSPDPVGEKIILEVSDQMGIKRLAIPVDEIVQRLLYPMVNEGAKILEEKIAIRATDIDVIWVYGYGWPGYRGGPVFWGESVGVKGLRGRMLDSQRQHGDQWKPAPLLNQLADQGKTLTGQ